MDSNKIIKLTGLAELPEARVYDLSSDPRELRLFITKMMKDFPIIRRVLVDGSAEVSHSQSRYARSILHDLRDTPGPYLENPTRVSSAVILCDEEHREDNDTGHASDKYEVTFHKLRVTCDNEGKRDKTAFDFSYRHRVEREEGDSADEVRELADLSRLVQVTIEETTPRSTTVVFDHPVFRPLYVRIKPETKVYGVESGMTYQDLDIFRNRRSMDELLESFTKTTGIELSDITPDKDPRLAYKRFQGIDHKTEREVQFSCDYKKNVLQGYVSFGRTLPYEEIKDIPISVKPGNFRGKVRSLHNTIEFWSGRVYQTKQEIFHPGNILSRSAVVIPDDEDEREGYGLFLSQPQRAIGFKLSGEDYYLDNKTVVRNIAHFLTS